MHHTDKYNIYLLQVLYNMYSVFKKPYLNKETYKNDPKTFTEYWSLQTNQLNRKVSRQMKARYKYYNLVTEDANYT